MSPWSSHTLRLLAGPALATALWLAPQAASAQLFGYWGYGTFRVGIYPEDVADIVADEGMRLIAPPHLNGRVYVADARDARGVQRRLLIDAAYGDVIKIFTVHGPQRDALDDFSPVPPRNIPSRKTARVQPAPEVIPGIGAQDEAPAERKPAAKHPKIVRQTPVETRPLAPVKVRPSAPPAPALPETSAAPEPAPAPSRAAAPVRVIPLDTPKEPAAEPAPLGDGGNKTPATPPLSDVPVAPLN